MSPCLFNLYAEYIIQSAGLGEAQAGIEIARRNINILRYADVTILMTESKEELKAHMMKVKEENEKADLKLNIQKSKIMPSSPVTSWQKDGETMETVTDFIFLGSKITADGDCSYEIKRHLLLGRKAMTNLDSSDFVDKDPYRESYVFVFVFVFFSVVVRKHLTRVFLCAVLDLSGTLWPLLILNIQELRGEAHLCWD